MQVSNSNLIPDPWYKEWRMVGAYVFYAICVFDFIIAPLATILINGLIKTIPPWTPLTTGSGGIFFFAFGGIVGLSTWSKFGENKEMFKFGQTKNDQTQQNSDDQSQQNPDDKK